MKVLPTARILLVDTNMERRQATRSALTAYGVGGVVEASSLEDAHTPAVTGAVDVLVVQVDDPEQVPENPFREGGGVPAILIVEVPAAMLARAAGRAGYDAALGVPFQPRILYRRIGSVLQRARRSVRPSLSTTSTTSAPEMTGHATAT